MDVAKSRGKSAIVVLGAMVLPSGQPSAAIVRRVRKALELYRASGEDFIVSGGNVTNPPEEAVVMCHMLAAAGVPKSQIHLESRSVNTIENIRFSKALAEELGFSKLQFVTDFYHVPRVKLTCWSLSLRPCVVSSGGAQDVPLLRKIRLLTREAFALPLYVLMLLVERK